MGNKFQRTLKILSAYFNGDLYKFLGPLLVFVEPTNLCNLKCRMCDRWRWQAKGNDKFVESKLTTQKLLEIFKELKVLGTKRVILTGGEVLLRTDISELLEGLNRIGIKPTVYTNGYLFNRKIALCVLKNKADISFSLDGFKAITHEKIRGVPGSFLKVINGVKLLSKMRKTFEENRQNTRIIVNYTIQEENVDDLKLGVRKIDELEVDSVRFALVHGPGKFCIKKESVQKIKKFVDSLKKGHFKLKTSISFSPFVLDLAEKKLSHGNLAQGLLCVKLLRETPVPCFVAHYSMVIDTLGRVFPCLYSHYDTNDFASYEEKRQRFVMGNVFRESLSDIWNGEKYVEFRKRVKLVTEKTIPEVCGQCEYYHKFKSYYFEFLKAQKFFKEIEKKFDFGY